MAEVSLSIGGQYYSVSCRDGEEDHLRTVAAIVSAKTREARLAVGDGLGEARQLLFAALLLADEVNELRKSSIAPADVATIERHADRLEALHEKLAPKAAAS